MSSRTLKRKVSDGSQEDSGPGGSQNKRVKATQSEAGPSTAAIAPNGQPTNKVLPVNIAFPPRIPGTLRIVSWNVCGLAASQKKGFKNYLEAEDPDILVLTETKVNNEPTDPGLNKRYPYRYWAISNKKTYSGTAILSKYQPINVNKTLPGHPNPDVYKGRIICLEFEHCFILGTYVVNAGEKLKTLDVKNEWNSHFETYIRELDKKKPVIWTGDLNVAPTEKDLSNAKKNWNKVAGYTEAETSSFMCILNLSAKDDAIPNKFVDVWRRFHPDDQHYTYFGYRFNCRAKGVGWRLDHFVLSERIFKRVKMCEIRSEIYGASDHCPLVLELEGEL